MLFLLYHAECENTMMRGHIIGFFCLRKRSVPKQENHPIPYEFGCVFKSFEGRDGRLLSQEMRIQIIVKLICVDSYGSRIGIVL